MKQVRIRSISGNQVSPWIYIQEEVKQNETPQIKQEVKIKELNTKPKSKHGSQYSRFKYSENQYGKIDGLTTMSSIEILKTPIRIKLKDGEWLYIQQTNIEGACPAIRIRNRYGNSTSPWVYLQQKEV